VLDDDVLEAQGFLEARSARFQGETVRVPPHWYDPRELQQLEVREGRRVALRRRCSAARRGRRDSAHRPLLQGCQRAELELRSTAAALELESASESRPSAPYGTARRVSRTTLNSIGEPSSRATPRTRYAYEIRSRKRLPVGLLRRLTGGP